MYKVTKAFDVCYGHRLPASYDGRCKWIHGHNARIEVTVQGDAASLNEFGMVKDFGELSAKCKGWCEAHLDHGMVLAADDPEKDWFIARGRVLVLPPQYKTSSVENVCAFLYEVFRALLGDCVCAVRVYETPTSWAQFEGGDFSNAQH